MFGSANKLECAFRGTGPGGEGRRPEGDIPDHPVHHKDEALPPLPVNARLDLSHLSHADVLPSVCMTRKGRCGPTGGSLNCCEAEHSHASWVPVLAIFR